MSERFVISDLHLGHSNLARMRKFSSAEEQDELIRERWCETVGKNDIVFVLGDVTLHRASHLEELEFASWPGRKVLIMGNHDDSNIIPFFDKAYGVNEVRAMNKKYHIAMTHIPMHPNEVMRWSFNMHGHLHTNVIDDSHYINVCAEMLNYQPQPLDEVVRYHVNRVLARKHPGG